MRTLRRALRPVTTALAGAALGAALLAAPPVADAREGLGPELSHLNLTYPAIHAVGVKGTHVPRKTLLLVTLDVDATLRVRVKDTDPYGLSRAFNVDLPAGDSRVPITARVDGTKMPPGRYVVVVKTHDSVGSSDKFRLHLRIVGKHG
jgi:hypothetical protein